MSVRIIAPVNPVFSAIVSGPGPSVLSSEFYLGGMFSAQAGWVVNCAAGLVATAKLLISQDDVTYYDSGQILPAITIGGIIFPVQYSGSFPWVKIQIAPTSGSAQVTINGSAKGGA